MFKRVISFLLALVLTVGTISPAMVYAEENNSGEEQEIQESSGEETPEMEPDTEEEPDLPVVQDDSADSQPEQQESYDIIPVSGDVASGSCGENLTWVLDESGTLTISGSGEMEAYGYNVDAPWFAHVDSITVVVVEEGVTALGEEVFLNHSSLTEIRLPKSLKSIFYKAFGNCTALEAITLPEELEWVSGNIFDGCTALKSVSLPEGITEIPYGMFYGCSSLTDVNIPASVTKIGPYAFHDCDSLLAMNIPQTVKTIEYGMFYGCDSLKTVTIADGVDVDTHQIFLDCSSLTDVKLPKGVTEIGSVAFAGCSALTGVEIPESVTVIANEAFWECTALEEIVLPDNVANIGEKAFYGCTALQTVQMPSSMNSIGAEAFYKCENLQQITIPQGIRKIEDSTFYSCESLTRVTIGDSVEEIGDYAFSRCSGLTNLSIPARVSVLGKFAFSSCSGLTQVVIPAGVTKLGNNLFSGCSGLKSVTIPDTVTDIGGNAFADCESLSALTLPNNISRIEGKTFYNCSALTEMVIPEGVTEIGDSAFSDCVSLEKITIPDSVQSIGSSAFASCTSLTGAVIPEGVTEIADSTFSWCSSLTSVTIPDSVTYIGSYAFHDCSELTNARIPDGVTIVDARAFMNCEKLTKLPIPDSVTAIGASAFSGCKGLTEMTIPEGVDTIYSYTFAGCNNLKKVTIPETVQTIEAYAFQECSSLAEIEIPAGVTAIERNTFSGCSSLSSIVIPLSVESIGYYAFASCYNISDVYYGGTEEQWLALVDAAEAGSSVLENVENVHYNWGSVGGTCGENLIWTLVDGTLIISVKDQTTASYEMQDYQPGTAPWKNYDISKIVIEQPVRNIGSHAFSGLANLKSVELAGSLMSIGEYAFSACPSLTEVDIPPRVSSIGRNAFYLCTGLTKCNLSANITAIPASLFSGCTSLVTVSIPAAATSIGEGAFFNCKALPSINIPAAVTSIEANTFDQCTSLDNVIFQEGLTNIGLMAFRGCTSLEYLCLPVSLSSVGNNAFSGCTALNYLEYRGTQAQWNALVQNGIVNDNGGNDPLVKVADIRFLGESGTVPSEPTEPTTPTEPTEPEVPNTVSGTCGNNVSWSLDRNTGKMTISGTGEMFDYWGGHGDYQPEPRYTPWNDVYALIKSVVIEPGVTKIGMYAFANCRITEVTIPETVTSINHHAFKDNLKLTDVYYGGSEADWNALKAKVGSNNEYLLGAPNIHFAGGEAESKSVRFYSGWNESEQKVYFGPDDDIGVLVTADTSSEFRKDPTSYRDHYVLVEIREEGDQEILLNMNLTLTQTGVVHAAANNSVTIADATFDIPDGLDNPNSYVGKNVLYHVYNGWLVGLEILQEEEGYLTYWNEEYNVMSVCFDLLEGKTIAYTVPGDAANGDAKGFLGEAGKKNQRIRFLRDKYRNVFMLEPAGFSAKYDAWCFVNGYEGFHYWDQDLGDDWTNLERAFLFPETAIEKVFGPAYLEISQNYRSMRPVWNGNCNGMAVSAILFYADELDWSDYTFGGEFSTVNDYHNLVRLDRTLKNKIHAAVETDDVVTDLIECYQILQYNYNDGYGLIDSSYDYLDDPVFGYMCETDTNKYEHLSDGNYIRKVYETIATSDVPLLISLQVEGAHAVVTRTDKAPEKMSDGWIRVYIYDPNNPYMSENLIEEYGYPPENYYLNNYEEDRYIELNPEQNKWRYAGSSLAGIPVSYHGCTKSGEIIYYSSSSEQYSPEFFIISNMIGVGIPGYEDFDGTEKWTSAHEDSIALYLQEHDNMVVSVDGQIICEVVDGKPVGGGELWEYYHLVHGIIDGDTTDSGRLTIPYTDFTIEYLDGEDITLVGTDSVINVASTGPVTLQVSMNEGKLEVAAGADSEVSMQVSDVYDNFTYTCLRADGSLDSGDTVTLQMKNDDFSAEFSGTGSLELSTKNEDAPENRVIGSLDENNQAMDIEDVREAPTQEHSHSYNSLSFAWTETNTCTAVFACSCGESSLSIPCVISSSFTAPTETKDGQVVYTAEAQREEKTYTDTKTIVIPAGSIRLDLPEDFGEMNAAWVDGAAVPVIHDQGSSFLYLPREESSILVTHTFHVGDAADIHTQYPLSMQVWRINRGEDGSFTAAHIPELDNILQYSGSSIRITGNKGIRMITSITRDNKSALTSAAGLGGYKLLEYGTALCFARELEGGKPLILGQEYTRSNYAYKKGVADPVFAYSGNLMQYTNVLVGFTNDQCKEDIAMRPYMILEDVQGSQITIYGGTVYRSIGYIAWQNRLVFSPGTNAYNFVWDIIHHVYGDQYDADYKK